MEKYKSEIWKGEFINDIIRDLNYHSYLELGISKGESWNQVFCDLKVGVDSNPNILKDGVINTLTDSFFSNLEEDKKFDVIYIDAFHEKNQVKKDFFNSLKALNNGGVIVLHDVNPPDKNGTSQQAHGDCFSFWCELVKIYPSRVAIFQQNSSEYIRDSVGLFFKNEDSFFDENFPEMETTYEKFDEKRSDFIHSLEKSYFDILKLAKQ